MLCVKCQKRPAVVFVQRLENGKTVQEGYCLTCARAMHIQPVDDLMKQFGMSDQDLENMEERMSSFLQEASDSGMLAPMMNGDDTDAGDEPAPQDDFVPGGSPVFPFGFGARQNKDDAKPKNGKKEKAPRRKFLETYCENLTQKARDGKTDRIIGRDREIYRTIQILCRRQKNNPCLIGEAGVGKTAIAEGIAQRIAEGKVPARLQDKEIYLLDMTSLVAGTQFRGQFEQRVKGLISEVKAAGNIILFIDEIHRLSPVVEEVLYPAMEDYQLDIMIGEGPAARSIKIDLPPFTLIGATTRAGSLTSPLRDRFGIVQRLEFYQVPDLQYIVSRSARFMGLEMSDDGALEVARRARGTPRIANRLLRRVRDFAEVKHDGTISADIAAQALDMLNVDAEGFDYMDRKLLLAVIDKFFGGPVGLDNLAAAIGEERETIEDVLEPYLIQQGFLQRTPRGRMATTRAWNHFGITPPEMP